MSQGELPRRFGEVESDESAAEQLPADRLKHSPVAAASDFAYFNHGVLFAYCDMDFSSDPVADWWARQGDSSLRILTRSLDYQYILGLDRPAPGDARATLGHLVYAVPRHLWGSLYDFMCGVVLNQLDRGYVAKLLPYTYRIRSREIRDLKGDNTFTVTVFGVAGSSASIRVRPSTNRVPCSSLRLVLGAASSEMSLLAKQIGSGDIDLAAEVENPSLEKFVLSYNDWIVANGGPKVELLDQLWYRKES